MVIVLLGSVFVELMCVLGTDRTCYDRWLSIFYSACPELRDIGKVQVGRIALLGTSLAARAVS